MYDPVIIYYPCFTHVAKDEYDIAIKKIDDAIKRGVTVTVIPYTKHPNPQRPIITMSAHDAKVLFEATEEYMKEHVARPAGYGDSVTD